MTILPYQIKGLSIASTIFMFTATETPEPGESYRSVQEEEEITSCV